MELAFSAVTCNDFSSLNKENRSRDGGLDI